MKYLVLIRESLAFEENLNSPAGVGHVFYTGYEYDGDTGLNYAGARYYEAKIGRFISQDSLVLNTPEKVLQDPQALNSYAYARNNPLIYIDPTGNFFETAWDVGNLVYDAGRLVKNTVEVNVGLAKYGYGVLTKNQSLQNSALTQMSGDLGDLKSAGIDTAFDAGATMIPFVPAGMTKVVGKADDAGKTITRFINGVEVKYFDKTFKGTVDLQPTLDRIEKGIKFPHRNDGAIHKNIEGFLPVKDKGYYKEFVHPTAGEKGAGVQRIIKGREGELYYSPDHYKTPPIRLDK